MSHFIWSMLLGVGFRLRPPVSYTTPLPTNNSGFLFTAFFGFHSSMVKVGGSMLPLFTASRPPMPKASMRDLSSTSTLKPELLANVRISEASCVALRKLTGSFTRSRAVQVASTMSSNSSTSLPLTSLAMMESFSMVGAPLSSLLYLRKA